MSSTAFIEPLPVIDFVIQLLNRDVTARPLSDADRVKVRFCPYNFIVLWNKMNLCSVSSSVIFLQVFVY